METIIIHKAAISQLKELKSIAEKTFADTFGPFNTKEDIEQYLATNFNETTLRNELTNPSSYFYLLYVEEKLAGYIKLNVLDAQTEKQQDTALEIERIYVLAALHGKQLGKLLLNKAVEVAKELNKAYIWLGVWEKNERAIGFYKKNGFVQFSTHLFKLGADVQTDYLFKLQLE